MFDVASSKDYEKVAQQVYQAILASDDVDTIEVMHNVQVVGRSGVKHQIDVYWRYLQDGIEHQVLVECKYYSSTIDLIHARNLLGLITDIPNSRGVLLTTVGYQRGVVDLCEYYGISLKRLRNPQGSDWDGCIQKVEIQGTLHKTDYLNVSINLDSKDLEAYTASAPDEVISINPLDYKLQDGTAPIASLSSWLDKTVPFDPVQVDQPFDVTLTPVDTYMVLAAGERLRVKSLDVHLVHTTRALGMSFDAMDVVRAVLEDFNTGKDRAHPE